VTDDAAVPLAGIRVLDFTQNLPGPYATLVLASLGAEVVKIEPPGGDTARLTPRLFEIVNAGKKSAVVDLKDESARAALHALVRDADVLVEGFRPGVMARFGLDPQHALELNPRLVYCSMSGYGQSGPYRDHPGHDLNFQALTGVCHLSRDDDDRPLGSALPIADLSSALTASNAILAALVARGRDGRGRVVDVALVDTVMSWSYVWSEGLTPSDGRLSSSLGAAREWIDRRGDAVPERLRPFVATLRDRLDDERVHQLADRVGEHVKSTRRWGRLTRLRLHALPHYGIYRTRDDRWLSIGIVDEDKFWAALCDGLHLPALRGVPLVARFVAATPLRRMIARAIVRHDLAYWLRVLDRHRIPIAPVLTVAEALADPQIQARSAVGGDPARAGGSGRVGAPAALVARALGPAPTLGQHTSEVGLPTE
jgi:CoA:oxalate CoA-transferase